MPLMRGKSIGIELELRLLALDNTLWYFFTRSESAVKRNTQRKGISKDFEELKSLFQVVEKGKTTWEATFDAIRDPVLIIRRDYRIERANVAAGEKAGVEIRRMIGRRCYEVFAGRKGVCPRCPLEATLGARASRTVEIEKLRPETDFQVSSYPLPLADGGQVVHHYRDVTEEKFLQKKLIQSEKMAAIGTLAGGVAHEINNPLGGILAFTQLIKAETPAESPIHGDLCEIEEAAKRCKKIVEDLLSFSRPSVGLETSPQDVNGLIEKLLPLLRLNLRESSITIHTDYGRKLPRVVGEASRLQQVFLNLIQNAAEAMKGGGEIRLRTQANGSRREISVEVEDSGPGINPEVLPRIFDPFFTTKGIVGTGLGLSICDTIVRDHRGRIEVETKVGQGTCFRVVLPAAAGGGLT